MVMEFLKRFLPGSAKQSERPSTVLELLEAADGEIVSTGNYTELANKAYKRHPTLFAAIRQITSAAKAVPWAAYQAAEDDRVLLPAAHQLSKLLLNPSGSGGWQRFLQRTIVYLYVGGWVWLVKARSGAKGDGKVQTIHAIRPDLLKLERGENGTVAYQYRTSPEEKPSRSYPASDVTSLLVLDPTSDMKGLSPISVASVSVEQGNSARLWNKNLLSNSARPSVMLIGKGVGNLGIEERERIETKFESRFSGYKKAGKVGFIQGDIDVKELGMSPEEMEWLEGQMAADRLCAITVGVPPQLVGDTKSQTFANYEQARRSLYLETVLPFLCELRDELNTWLVPEFGDDLTVDFITDDVDALQESGNTRADRLAKSDWMTLGEKRSAAGLDLMGTDSDKLIILGNGVLVLPDGQILAPQGLVPIEGREVAEETETETDKSADLHIEFKLRPSPFGLKTEEEKMAYWKQFDNLRERHTRSARALVARIMNSERMRIISAVENAASVDAIAGLADREIAASAEQLSKAIETIYVVTGRDFARRVLDSLPKSARTSDFAYLFASEWSREIKQDEEFDDPFREEIRSYLSNESAKKVTSISNTTRDRIRKALTAGSEAGEGIDKLARRLDGILKQTIPFRSEVVARTEVISASNLSSQATARSTGLDLNKEWIATRDDRVRGFELEDEFDHLAADGQTVHISQPYTVSGQQLMFPGDTSLGATAANVIQCRCTEGYHVL